MILVGHQPEYIPYLGFFQKVARADHLILVDHVQYARKDFQNRNYVRNHEGKILLSVPVLSRDKFDQTIREVVINNTSPWTRKHWRSISLAYSKAPFFEKYAPDLQTVYEKSWIKLSDLTIQLIRILLGWFDVRIPISISSEMGFSQKGTAMLIEMCRKVGADHYISGQGARGYVNIREMKAAGIGHHFSRFVHPVYPQFQGNFICNLSVLDLFFNCGDGAKDVLRCCVEMSVLEDE